MLKRAIDIGVSLCGIAVAAIPMAVTAAAIKLTMGSPVLYRQPRQGLNGEYFNILKFRSMTDGVTETGELLPNPKRITKVGNFIRHTSLDELPQLFNVLKGDMSLVGPRPAYFDVPEQYHERFSVKPGMTGLAQVNGRKSCSLEERMAFDLEYVRNQSLEQDLTILLKTFSAVVSGKGTGSLTDIHTRAARGENVDPAEYRMTLRSSFPNRAAIAEEYSVSESKGPELLG